MIVRLSERAGYAKAQTVVADAVRTGGFTTPSGTRCSSARDPNSTHEHVTAVAHSGANATRIAIVSKSRM